MSVRLEQLMDEFDRWGALEALVVKHCTAARDELLHKIIEEKDRIRKGWTHTTVSGCVSPAHLEAAPDVADDEPVGFVEPVDSSAMIPPRELNRSQRGGE